MYRIAATVTLYARPEILQGESSAKAPLTVGPGICNRRMDISRVQRAGRGRLPDRPDKRDDKADKRLKDRRDKPNDRGNGKSDKAKNTSS